MTNPLTGLALAFHFNPSTIEFDKQNNWDIDSPIGFNAPIVTWTSGGEKRMRFDLVFDNTQGAIDSNIVTFNVPLTGARGAISIIESFLEPEKALIQFLEEEEVAKPPPECYVILGLRFWRTRLMSAPIQELLYNKLLTPTRIMSFMEFLILEEGVINQVNQATRKTLALVESTVGFSSTFLTVF